MTPDEALVRVREIALALPGTGERLSHGSPGFHIEKGKFSAYFSNDHHDDGECAVLVKTSGVEEQAMLIEHDPESYYRPAYFGVAGWIGIRVTRAEADWDGIGDRIAQSWEMVAPRRLLEAGGR